MATQNQDGAKSFHMAPEKLRRPYSHPFPPNPGKCQGLPSTSSSDMQRRPHDIYTSQNEDRMQGDLKRKRSGKSDIHADGVTEPENLSYGYESYLAYDTFSSGIKGVKEGKSLPPRTCRDFFNLSASSYIDPAWESDGRYSNLFSNQNQTGLGDSEGSNFTQAQWSNSKEFSQVPLHPSIDLTSGSTFLPFQYKNWEKDPKTENGTNLEFSEKEMIEEIEYMFAQNEWDLPVTSPPSQEASTIGMTFEDTDQQSEDDGFKEGSVFSDLCSKAGSQERTHPYPRFQDYPCDLTANNKSISGEIQSQQPKVLHLEDLGDSSSLSSEEKQLLESLILKMNSKKRVNGLGKMGQQSKETVRRATETPVKEADKCAIGEKSSSTVGLSTVKSDLSKLGQPRIKENGGEIGSTERVLNQGDQRTNRKFSDEDSEMLDDSILESARKRSKDLKHEGSIQSMQEGLSKRDHSGKTKEEIVSSPTPSKNAKIQVEKTLKKQKVFQSEVKMPSEASKESFEPQKSQEIDIEMDNAEEETQDVIHVTSLNGQKHVAAKRQHNGTEKHEGNVDNPHPEDSSPPELKKKKKKKRKQAQSSKNIRKGGGNVNPGSDRVGESVIAPDHHQEATCTVKCTKQDGKEERCTVGHHGREHVKDSEGPVASIKPKTQQDVNEKAEEKKNASAWTQVSGKKRGLHAKVKVQGDGLDISQTISDKSCSGASRSNEPQGNITGDAKVGREEKEEVRRNGLGSFENQEMPQSIHQGHSGGTIFKRKEKEREANATLKNLKEDKDMTVPQPQASPSESVQHPSSVPLERVQKGCGSKSTPTTTTHGSQPAWKMETKPEVFPNETGYVLKDEVKCADEASKTLPQASVSSSSSSASSFSSSSASSLRNGKCQKESRSSRLGMNAKKETCDKEEFINEERQTEEQERERNSKQETKAASSDPYSKMAHRQQSVDGGLNKPSSQTKRDSEKKDESKDGRTFEELQGKRQTKNDNENLQRQRSESGIHRKPGRDSTAKCKQSTTSRSGHIFQNKHQNFARWKKKITLENFTNVFFAIVMYLKCLAAEVMSELPQFGGLLLLCLLVQGLSTFHYFKDLCTDAVVDIFNIAVASLRLILSKCGNLELLWNYILKPALLIALLIFLLACYIVVSLIKVVYWLLRAIYRLRYPVSTDGFAHQDAKSNASDASWDRQEQHSDSFNTENDQRHGHTSNGFSENNSGHHANLSGDGEEPRGSTFTNFSSYKKDEGISGGSPFGSSSSSTTNSPNKSQSSQSSDSRPYNKEAVPVIQRILLAEEDNPYDVLGLGTDCLQDDIKRAYRRLAVIVHPDKCNHPDAQRAFQKLQVSHDKIGSEENRAQFDMEKRGRDLARDFMDECQKQYDLIKNSIRCQCGSLHPKTLTTRNPLTARYCWQHNTFHLAHQNDIWVETSCMGLKIHCFVCDEGRVFDVTHWARCQKLLGRVEKNACRVTVKMEDSLHSQSKPPDTFEDFVRNFEAGAYHRGRGGFGSDRSKQKDKNSKERNNKKKKRNGRR